MEETNQVKKIGEWSTYKLKKLPLRVVGDKRPYDSIIMKDADEEAIENGFSRIILIGCRYLAENGNNITPIEIVSGPMTESAEWIISASRNIGGSFEQILVGDVHMDCLSKSRATHFWGKGVLFQVENPNPAHCVIKASRKVN